MKLTRQDLRDFQQEQAEEQQEREKMLADLASMYDLMDDQDMYDERAHEREEDNRNYDYDDALEFGFYDELRLHLP